MMNDRIEFATATAVDPDRPHAGVRIEGVETIEGDGHVRVVWHDDPKPLMALIEMLNDPEEEPGRYDFALVTYTTEVTTSTGTVDAVVAFTVELDGAVAGVVLDNERPLVTGGVDDLAVVLPGAAQDLVELLSVFTHIHLRRRNVAWQPVAA